jgi:cell division protein FtsI (penicillin-binding protein 3)
MEYINSLGLDKVRNIQNISGYGFRGIKAPGYAKGSSWSPKTLANNAYGYELTMTPMQTLMFYNAVANGGRLVAPMLIKQVVREGVVIEEAAPTIINPAICSQATLDKVQECMEAVVTYKYGTANTLKDLPFKVAGKTGTAQVVQPKEKWGKDKNGKPNAYITLDGSREYVATFVGYFPADNPKYSCIVMMNTFQRADESNKKIYGSNLAMPVFREISEYIYSHDPEWFNTATRRAVAPQQSKAIGAPATREGTVPNVKGMGLRDALYELEKAGLKVSFKGQGAVVEQSVKPGSPIEAGMEVSLTLGSEKSNNK